MGKEFVINDDKLLTVECDIPTDFCPVVKMLQRNVGAYEVATPRNDRPTTISVLCEKNDRNLKHNAVNLCMHCNVKVR